jgi:hypothetical protein
LGISNPWFYLGEREVMRIYNAAEIASLMLCVAAAGCATSRSEIRLTSPIAIAPTASGASARTVVIRSIADERVFEESPNDPSTPSLGFGGAAKASTEIKDRAIGRKRNTYGKALGDVLLENGQTVESVIRENLTAAFQQAGYQVKSDVAESGPSPLVIDVHIKQFWAWIQPGFFAATLNTNITTDLDIGTSASTLVSIHAEDTSGPATDSAWLEIVQRGLKEYRAQATSKASALP